MTKELKAATTFTLFVKLADIKAETARLNTVGSTYQADLHVLACSVLAHVSKNRNVTVLQHFIESLPAAVRVNSVQKWFETFGNVSYSAIEGSKESCWRLDNTKKTRLGEAMIKPFWKFKANEGMPYTPLDMDTWTAQTIKKLETDQKEAKRDHSALILALKGYKSGVTVTQ
jgi:hypothetical protein